jgi:hypothetical protein
VADEPIQQPAQEPMQEPIDERAEEPAARLRVEEEDERYRGATPPGYDWPTHGGYLGCLIGVMLACLLAPLGYILFGFVGAFLIHPLGGFGVALSVLITIGVYVAVFIALSRLGWSMGKRFLREYAQPARPVWGEDDDEAYPLVVDADPPVASAADGASESEPAAEPTPPHSETAS